MKLISKDSVMALLVEYSSGSDGEAKVKRMPIKGNDGSLNFDRKM